MSLQESIREAVRRDSGDRDAGGAVKGWRRIEPGWYRSEDDTVSVCKETVTTAPNNGGDGRAGWYVYTETRSYGAYPTLREACEAWKMGLTP
jgi:hypothetical protein